LDPEQDLRAKAMRSDGPAFEFPAELTSQTGVSLIEDEKLLPRALRSWVPGEIEAGRAPVLTIDEGGAT
jgi:hypothetical protein